MTARAAVASHESAPSTITGELSALQQAVFSTSSPSWNASEIEASSSALLRLLSEVSAFHREGRALLVSSSSAWKAVGDPNITAQSLESARSDAVQAFDVFMRFELERLLGRYGGTLRAYRGAIEVLRTPES